MAVSLLDNMPWQFHAIQFAERLIEEAEETINLAGMDGEKIQNLVAKWCEKNSIPKVSLILRSDIKSERMSCAAVRLVSASFVIGCAAHWFDKSRKLDSVHYFRIADFGNIHSIASQKSGSDINLREQAQRIDELLPAARTGAKIIAASKKGNSKQINVARDASIAAEVDRLKRPRNLLVKTIHTEVGKVFGIGPDAVKKACERHAIRNSK